MSTRIFSGFTRCLLPALLVLLVAVVQGSQLSPAQASASLTLVETAGEYNFTPATLSTADLHCYALLSAAESTENESQEEESKAESAAEPFAFKPVIAGSALKKGTFTRFFTLTVPLYIRYHRWKTPAC